ncbi:MAG: divalent-cation tolerance protein CutA [Planctomycetes bacterium]|nr:divalent-cation tolerance protein CutA [Planctomycetota bacterium]
MSGSGSEDARVVLVTAPEIGVARALARGLLERRLAACVNLLPGLESHYRWKGALESASEVLLLVKTRAAHLPRLEAFLAQEHPYECPECIALEPAHVERSYLEWLLAETAP